MGPQGGRARLRRTCRDRPRGRHLRGLAAQAAPCGRAAPSDSLSGMTRQRDPFADFGRMRREMDELLGDFWEQAGTASAARWPASSRAWTSTTAARRRPSRRSSRWSCPGSSSSAVNLEVRGRALVISGERPVRETEGRTYQQVELPSGPFRRVVELSVDVDAEQRQATYEDGILRVELPIRAAGCRPPGPDRARRVADGARGRRLTMADVETPQLEVVEIPDVEEASRSDGAAARRPPDPAAAGDRHLPGHAHPARGRPGALRSSSSTTSSPATGCWRWSPPGTPRTTARSG